MRFIETVGHLPRAVRSRWKRLRGKQDLDHPFLRLPPELICYIAEFLTPVDLALCSQTCRSLRTILGSNAACLSRTEYFTYLASRARGLPERWVCEKCTTLHSIVKLDTPSSIYNMSSCPRYAHGKRRDDTRLHYNQFPIDHHHFQLALKYTRLQRQKYNSYLKDLMALYYDVHFGPSAAILIKTHYMAFLKIVADNDGNFRFFFLFTWRYYKSRENISLYDLGYQLICPYFELNYCTSLCFRSGLCYVFEKAVREAIEARRDNQDRTGACLRCATDFSVQLTPEYLDLHAWQDFGPEGPPVDLAWKSQSNGTDWEYDKNWRFAGPTLYHEPGSIRRLYGPEIPEKVVKLRNQAPVPVHHNSRPLTDTELYLAVWPALFHMYPTS
ncbi:hypothetical protein F4809DRAFT_282570 [Biscogniauxia mediterranea]|nr:hypothetical protein F4809DRAFT_282570 [Biscogniauxia mediterranea]